MHADAIIVLGGGISDEGALDPIPQARVAHACSILKKHPTAHMIMSGKWGFLISFTPPRTESEAMKEYALTHGISDEKIIIETDSMDTIGNAYFTKKNMLKPRGWHNIIVVTSDFHAPRTDYIFRKVLGRDYTLSIEPAPTQLTDEERQARNNVEERVLAFTKEHLDPIANGDDHSIKELLDQFPGYSDTPKYTVEQLRELIGNIKKANYD